jgi:hypothetical protein
MESGGKSPTFTGSQEVIGSIPICSTQRIKGLQTSRFAALFSFVDTIVPAKALVKERVTLSTSNNYLYQTK